MNDNELKETPIIKKRTLKSFFKDGFAGILLGLAVILPGISGSTIAILFKIYDKILYSVSNIFKKFKICFLFLLPIVIGMIIGFCVGFFAIQSIIEDYTFILVCVFGGMMLGATPEIIQIIRKEKITPLRISLTIIGFSIPIILSAVFANVIELDMSQIFDDFPWWIHLVGFLVGILTSLTQIIPGLSATVLLMSIGFFTPMMNAVSISELSSQPIWILFFFVFVLGFVVGFFLLSKLFTLLFNKWHTNMYFLVTGLTFGSIVSIFYNKDVYDVYTNIWPNNSNKMTLDLSIGIPLFVICTIAVFLFVYFFNKRKEKHEQIDANKDNENLK